MMPRRDRKRPSRTPVRVALRESSGLRERVQDDSRNGFADTEKARRRLDENGIEFTGQVQAKHLPAQSTKRAGKGR